MEETGYRSKKQEGIEKTPEYKIRKYREPLFKKTRGFNFSPSGQCSRCYGGR